MNTITVTIPEGVNDLNLVINIGGDGTPTVESDSSLRVEEVKDRVIDILHREARPLHTHNIRERLSSANRRYFRDALYSLAIEQAVAHTPDGYITVTNS